MVVNVIESITNDDEREVDRQVSIPLRSSDLSGGL
jgi:hypothetical protein